MLLLRSLAFIPAAITNCAALMFVPRHRTHLFLCGQTSHLPIPMARPFPFIPATIRWATSPSRSPFTVLSLSVATSSSPPIDRISNSHCRAGHSLLSSTISTSIQRFGNPSYGKAWKALTSSIRRSMAAQGTSMELARADSRSNSSTRSGPSTAPTLCRAPRSVAKSQPCCPS